MILLLNSALFNVASAIIHLSLLALLSNAWQRKDYWMRHNSQFESAGLLVRVERMRNYDNPSVGRTRLITDQGDYVVNGDLSEAPVGAMVRINKAGRLRVAGFNSLP